MEIPKEEIIVSEKVAILIKDNKVGAIGLSIKEHGTTLNMFDENGITVSPMYSPLIGIKRFQGSLEKCAERGWSVGFFGEANYG